MEWVVPMPSRIATEFERVTVESAGVQVSQELSSSERLYWEVPEEEEEVLAVWYLQEPSSRFAWRK